eukprot:gene8184-biopygen21130
MFENETITTESFGITCFLAVLRTPCTANARPPPRGSRRAITATLLRRAACRHGLNCGAGEHGRRRRNPENHRKPRTPRERGFAGAAQSAFVGEPCVVPQHFGKMNTRSSQSSVRPWAPAGRTKPRTGDSGDLAAPPASPLVSGGWCSGRGGTAPPRRPPRSSPASSSWTGAAPKGGHATEGKRNHAMHIEVLRSHSVDIPQRAAPLSRLPSHVACGGLFDPRGHRTLVRAWRGRGAGLPCSPSVQRKKRRPAPDADRTTKSRGPGADR